ncbi:DUF421 domain-containing protein [Paenibacillus sp. YYML68]|uniref:DUF421 domain-containing protein n=1 Tax=Paenibacillus sp. YYML68 TaxID=2909250 RepID=UPI0024902CFF|nr:YetF domain-containing protein [Paenibacillus sp. YYML68]
MLELAMYGLRCIVMLLITWAAIRLLGKKTIAQMSAFELAGLMLLTTVAAQPLVVKVASKAAVGVLSIGVFVMLIGYLSLNRFFYNLDAKPELIIVNGDIDHRALRKNQINLPFFLSMLREKGYGCVSDIEYAILEPNGTLSVFPKATKRPVTTADLELQPSKTCLALALIIDGVVQQQQLDSVGLTEQWLEQQCQRIGVQRLDDIFLAELMGDGRLHVSVYQTNVPESSIQLQ